MLWLAGARVGGGVAGCRLSIAGREALVGFESMTEAIGNACWMSEVLITVNDWWSSSDRNAGYLKNL